MFRKTHSIHRRLFLLFLLCMAGILLVMSVLYYYRSTSQIKYAIRDQSAKNVAQTAALFNLLLDSYDSLSKSIIGSLDLVRLLRLPPPDRPEVAYINATAVSNILGSVFLSRDDLIGIRVITDDGRIFNYGKYFSANDPNYRLRDWYRRLKSSSGEMVWLGVYPRSVFDELEDRPVFAFGRVIYDLNVQEPIGVVLIEAKPQTILSALANLKLTPGSDVYLLSGRDRIVSAASAQASERLPDPGSLPRPAEGEAVTVKEENGLMWMSAQLPVADWTVVSRTPSRELYGELAETQRVLAFVVALLIIAAVVTATVMSRTISSPLKRLIREMKRVELGDFRAEVNVSSYQEINTLAHSFNQMVGRIAELIEQVKISSVSEKNAELHALQSQVNPHFLYNTLDMIYWMLDEKGNDKLGDVVLSLSAMFRYSSHWDDGAQATLREEAEQIRHYLTIIRVRFENRLRIELELDEAWMHVRLPKMTLQPIIENAVKHGLEPLQKPGLMLRVYTVTEGRSLTIMIEDNGVGMERKKLRQLQESLADGQASAGARGKGGIGLTNLQRRLRHMYGDRAALEAFSSPGGGTAVAVVVPLAAEGEETA